MRYTKQDLTLSGGIEDLVRRAKACAALHGITFKRFCSEGVGIRNREGHSGQPAVLFHLWGKRIVGGVQGPSKQKAPPCSGNCDIELLVKARYSTRQAAAKLGITLLKLQRHVSAKTFKAPPLQEVGGVRIRLWNDRDIARARKALAGVRRGRRKKEA